MPGWTEQDGVFTLTASATVQAPIARVFDLTCCIALVREELGMKPMQGRSSGLVQAGDTVRWEGWQLGLPQFHVTLISGFQRPQFMQDTMLDGRFKTFQHDHHLRPVNDDTTELHDALRFSLPYGVAGYAVARWIMVPHIQQLLRNRFARLKRIAEGDGWRRYLPEDDPGAA